MGREPVSPLKIPNGVKATCGENVEFLTETFFWYTKQNRAFRIKIILMHDSVLSCDEKNPLHHWLPWAKMRETHGLAPTLPSPQLH